MDSNAEFVEDIYRAAKAYRANYTSKKIVIVFDNAPCHNQTEKRSVKHRDLILLRLAPYSPIWNPIEGCFSVLKSHIKDVHALERDALNTRPTGNNENGSRITISGHQMEILENSAGACMRFTPLPPNLSYRWNYIAAALSRLRGTATTCSTVLSDYHFGCAFYRFG
ncbi:hypothetical protein JG687_00019249 [Phytophthora cactorum]|uniref:Tc1-like transposase DDE domain-containing protein n=1 Tax=Phytophthora cactorum TaxID=29920 RepID=A0A8T1TK22_9STRA|nr:hypothetical protein JG687_00019249 [Phytophthora cactorum]